jgi:hypothetical protein
LWLVPPYLILMLAAWVVSNIWYEVRVYMTLYPLLLPLILWYLWPSQALDIGQAAIEAPTTGPAQSPAGR